MGEVNAASAGGSHQPHPKPTDFERRILSMLEGAAFALLESQIREREAAARVAAAGRLQRERDEVVRLHGEVEATKEAADRRLREAKEYEERVRKRVRKAVRGARLYRRALEKVHERLDELTAAADGWGIANELEAILKLIDKAFSLDPDFQ